MSIESKNGVVKSFNQKTGLGIVYIANEEVRLSVTAAGAFVDQLVAKAFLTMDVAPGPGNLDVIVAVTAVEPPRPRPQAAPAKPAQLVKVDAPREEGVLAAVKSFDPKKGGVIYLSGNPDRLEATLSAALFETRQELLKGTPLLVSIIQNSEGWFVTKCEFGPSVESAFHDYMKSQLQLIAEQQAAAGDVQVESVAPETSSVDSSPVAASASKPQKTKVRSPKLKGEGQLVRQGRGKVRVPAQEPAPTPEVEVDPALLQPIPAGALESEVVQQVAALPKGAQLGPMGAMLQAKFGVQQPEPVTMH